VVIIQIRTSTMSKRLPVNIDGDFDFYVYDNMIERRLFLLPWLNNECFIEAAWTALHSRQAAVG
jgi:hypothetical protein